MAKKDGYKKEKLYIRLILKVVPCVYDDISYGYEKLKDHKICDVEKDEIYADVQIVMDYGVKYIVRLQLRVTESGDLRFIGAVG